MDLVDLVWSVVVIGLMTGYFLVLYRAVETVVRDPGLGGRASAAWVAGLVLVPVVGLLAFVAVRIPRRRPTGDVDG